MTKFSKGSLLLFVLFIAHALVGAVELGTDGWIQNITGNILNPKQGKYLFVFTSALMFALRFCAHFIEKNLKLSPVGLLMVCAMLAGTSAGSSTAERSTKDTPSGNSAFRRAAAAQATLVLPVPPGPVNVSSRTPSREISRRMTARSSSRPNSGVLTDGKGRRRNVGSARAAPCRLFGSMDRRTDPGNYTTL